MPVFLAFVRGHNALEIGTIMLVTGVVQLITAPVAVALEQRVEARVLTALGFGLFAVGLGLSAFQTPQSDYDALFWPQILRGLAIMFCLLPPTRMALGLIDKAQVADASGLFNLMRNLGGAIGLALIDTVIYSRSAVHSAYLVAKLQQGDVDTVRFLGLALQTLSAPPAAAAALVQPFIEKGALTLAINEAWGMIALLTLAALLCVPFARRSAANTA